MIGLKEKVFFLLIIVLSLMLGACSNVDSQDLFSLDHAPNFSLKNLQGENITLSEVLKEKKAVLVFFATWCPSCVREVPRVNEFYTANENNTAIIGIDIRQSKAQAEAFAKERGVLYPIVLDINGQVADVYEIRGIPTLVAIDQDGTILYKGHSMTEMTQKVDF